MKNITLLALFISPLYLCGNPTEKTCTITNVGTSSLEVLVSDLNNFRTQGITQKPILIIAAGETGTVPLHKNQALTFKNPDLNNYVMTGYNQLYKELEVNPNGKREYSVIQDKLYIKESIPVITKRVK